MNQHIATLVLLSTMLVHANGMSLEEQRRHPRHHRHSKHHNQMEDEMSDNLEDVRGTYQRAKRNHDRVMNYEFHVGSTIKNNSRCKSFSESDSVTDTSNSSFVMKLRHVKCNLTSSATTRCNKTEHKCCRQMYTSINIKFSNGKEEEKKIYTGCMYVHPVQMDLTSQLTDSSWSM